MNEAEALELAGVLLPLAVQAVLAAIKAGHDKDTITTRIKHIEAEQIQVSVDVDGIANGA